MRAPANPKRGSMRCTANAIAPDAMHRNAQWHRALLAPAAITSANISQREISQRESANADISARSTQRYASRDNVSLKKLLDGGPP